MDVDLTIRINADGNVTYLYQDGAQELFGVEGKVQVERASNVEFDPAQQMWVVHVVMADGNRWTLPTPYHKRADAIAAEIQFLQKMLVEMPTEFLPQQFR